MIDNATLAAWEQELGKPILERRPTRIADMRLKMAITEIRRLREERNEAREVIAKVNNSFGSYNYFTDPHPADQVEKLKAQTREQYRALAAHQAVIRELAKYVEEGGKHGQNCDAGCPAKRLLAHPLVVAARKHETANVLKTVTSEWDHTHNPGEVACHSRMVGGVLCRWWGNETPPGVALINEAARKEGRDE